MAQSIDCTACGESTWFRTAGNSKNANILTLLFIVQIAEHFYLCIFCPFSPGSVNRWQKLLPEWHRTVVPVLNCKHSQSIVQFVSSSIAGPRGHDKWNCQRDNNSNINSLIIYGVKISYVFLRQILWEEWRVKSHSPIYGGGVKNPSFGD